jgi:hypothetical protein
MKNPASRGSFFSGACAAPLQSPPMSASSVLAGPSSLLARAKAFAASAAVVWTSCALYALAPYNQRLLSERHGGSSFSFSGAQFLFAGALVYGALLALYHALEADPGTSKSLRFWRVLRAFLRAPATAWRCGLAAADRLAVLTTLLKGFFGPMMTMYLMAHCTAAIGNGVAITGAWGEGFVNLFDRYGFWFAMQVILFIDVLVFTLGYLIELPRLDNRIRSVDPSLLGWAAALLCYPPFNSITGAILGSPVSDFPQFDDPTAHLVLNATLLSLMAAYAGASLALGFKASNLTHRGIVARGPYAWVRHPAYTCKNMAWWIAAAPLVSAAFARSAFEGVSALASMAGWSLLYVLRALTEEDHLRSVDGEYATYAAKVRFRFIPGVA